MVVLSNLLGILSYLVIQHLLVDAKSTNSKYCYNSVRDLQPYLASKPQNQFIQGDIERVEGCTPLQIWMTARHDKWHSGPTSMQQMIDLDDFRDRIITNHENGRGLMCSEDLINLSLWQKHPNFYEIRNNALGDKENEKLQLIAKHVKDVFPQQSNDPKNYTFQATIQDQATLSLISFANALLNTSATVDYEDDELKKPADCPGWQKEHSREQQTTEFKKFRDGPYVQRALDEIRQRLGFIDTVGLDTVSVIYEVCHHETALNPAGNISAWCTVFSKEDLMVFKYLNDLDYYYCCGPGNRLRKKISCGILEKLFNIFSQMLKEHDSNKTNGAFNLNQASHVQSLQTLLKVYHPDEPLLASNYELLKHRLFNTSFINSFKSNVVAVLYRCDNITMPNQVQFHVGDDPVELPDCEGHNCYWEYMKQQFRPVLDSCDLNLCDLPREYTMTSASSTCEDSFLHYLILMIFFSFSYYGHM